MLLGRVLCRGLPSPLGGRLGLHGWVVLQQGRLHVLIVIQVGEGLGLGQADQRPDGPGQLVTRPGPGGGPVNHGDHGLPLLVGDIGHPLGAVCGRPVLNAFPHGVIEEPRVGRLRGGVCCLGRVQPDSLQVLIDEVGVVLLPGRQGLLVKVPALDSLPQLLVGDCLLLVVPEAGEPVDRLGLRGVEEGVQAVKDILGALALFGLQDGAHPGPLHHGDPLHHSSLPRRRLAASTAASSSSGSSPSWSSSWPAAVRPCWPCGCLWRSRLFWLSCVP